MATVYLARDLRHDRLVAVKILRLEVARSLGTERFLREVRLTANLQHPHILPLLDSGTFDEGEGPRPWYAMPFVDGESLRARLDREGRIPVDEAIALAQDVASALAFAHARGVIHRDIKPENILLSAGHAVVADFGIARALTASGSDRLTTTGLVLGTPRYMSPEQAAGGAGVGPSADIYSLGCVLYEMLAGEPPVAGAPPRAPRDTVPEPTRGAIARALALVPDERFGTAEEFAGALGKRAAAPRRGVFLAGAAAALLLVAVMATGLWLRVPSIIPAASVIAVLPFEPSGPDTALTRLGRDLVFTLSASLDGLGGIRVVDAHAVLAGVQTGVRSVAQATEMARRLGAGGIVHGSLVREGPGVRLDFVLLPTGEPSTQMARGSVTGAPDSVAALTDSATRSLLRQVWARGTPPTPSLDGALKTRSAAALRAFLQGEGELAAGAWERAAASYERAMVEDTTFWLAYARHVLARNWALKQPAEDVLTRLTRHRAELPERERLATEGVVALARGGIGEALDRARELTERYPTSWFGWLLYGDWLLHSGPYLGHSQSEARAALERARELNPDLIPAWEHGLLLALLFRDTTAAGQALRALTRLDAGPTLSSDGYGNRMLQFRYLDALVRGDSALVYSLTDSLVHDHAPAAELYGSFYDPFCYGFLAEQIRLSEAALRRPVPSGHHRRILAQSWAGRGVWDSALAALDRFTATGTDPAAALGSYGMAVVGEWIGAVEPVEATRRREPAVSAAGQDPEQRAELAWLDGIAAAARRDGSSLARARVALRQSGSPGAAALGRSLAAFEADLRGSTREAAAAMAKLEWEEAALMHPSYGRHPYAIPVNRLAGARWLAATGDHEQAARLLAWAEGPYLLHPTTDYATMFAGLADLERGRIAEQGGHAELAAGYYQEFLRRYDRPVAAHRALVEEVARKVEEGWSVNRKR